MAPLIECPPADILRDLLWGLGDVADVETLESHIATCPACAERAGRVPGADEFVRTVQHVGSRDDTPVPELVDSLASAFRRMGSKDATRSWSLAPTLAPDALLAPATRGDEIGTIGPYAIREVLGAGGMGLVYRGYDERLDREVAVKVIRPELVSAAGMVDRFLAEARAAAAVEHDHIVTVHAVELHNGVPCIVMPLLKGQTLEQWLKQSPGPCSTQDVLRIGREAAGGLAAAHERGLIHRDIKPGNLWLEAPAGRLKILDFGLAVVAESADAKGSFAGTPGYAAPEQIRGSGLDHRADLYSLGCVLFRTATGRPVFVTESQVSAMVNTLTRTPAATSSLNPKLHAPLAGLIDSLLKKNPDERPASAEAVLAEIRAIEAGFVARQKRITRRRWLVATTAAGLAGAAAVWLGRPPEPLDVPPVRVELVAESDMDKVILTSSGQERVVNLGKEAEIDLAPGDYTLRAAPAVEHREVVPGSLVILPGEPRTVKLALVGQVAASKQHSGPVTGVAAVAAKDRFAVLSTGFDRTLSCWVPGASDPPKWVKLASPSQCFASSADGSVVATAGGNKQPPTELDIQLWDGRTLEPRGKPLAGHTRKLFALAMSADGTKVLSAAVAEIFLWDTAARSRRELIPQPEKAVTAAFDAAGKWAMTGHENGYAVLWDVETGKPVRRFTAQSPGSDGAVRGVAFSPTGFVTVGDDGVVRLWDRETFKSRELPASTKAVLCVALSRSHKRLLTGDATGVVKLWALPEGVVVHTFAGHGKPVLSVAFSPDGRNAVSGGEDEAVRVWRLPFE